jgi:hypothetical protein
MGEEDSSGSFVLVLFSGHISTNVDMSILLQAADAWSTAYVAQAIIKLCGDLKQYKTLNEQIHLLFKRRAQLKKPQQAIVQDAMLYLDGMDKADKLELIDTLRTVSAGKIFVEIERARVTLMLSKMKEEEGNIAAASDTLQEIQVCISIYSLFACSVFSNLTCLLLAIFRSKQSAPWRRRRRLIFCCSKCDCA